MIVKWAETARRDRRGVYRYYLEDVGSPRTADRIDAAIFSVNALLSAYPHAGRAGRIAGSRELVIKDTPYLAVYRVADQNVMILRLFHHAQRWPRRL